MTSDTSAAPTIKVRVFTPPTAQARGGLRILLLKLDHIGDFITSIEAFRILRAAFSGAEITLICLPVVAQMAERTGLFDRVAAFPVESDGAGLGLTPVPEKSDAAAFTALLDGRYFLAADFKHDGETRRWLDLVDAELRAGFATPTAKGLDILLPNMDWDVSPLTIGAGNLPLHAELRLTLLAQTIAETLLDKPLDPDLFKLDFDLDKEPVYRALADEKRTRIGISLGAGSELRQWPAPYWFELLQRLLEKRDTLLVFFGGPGDKEATAALTGQLPPGSFTDLTAALPLPSLPAYMNLLDYYIGCDTGLTHLAARLGVPTIDIFAGISTIPVWRARGPRVKTIYAEAPCAPCHLRFRADCPNNHVCMKVILPAIAFACFEQLAAAP